MTNQEILEKAIQKAIDGGWNLSSLDPELKYIKEYCNFLVEQGGYMALLTRHDFAKALWGEEDAAVKDGLFINWPNWQYHLQQMVIADDPIKYLGENL